MNNLQEQLQPLKNQENTYQKKHKTFEQQLELLKQRGLAISNYQYALTKLQHINYYRLSAYFLPFQFPKNSEHKNKFLPDTTFEDIIKLYYFDTELRKIIFEAIEVIEIYLRTQISYYHSKSYDAFGYLDISHLRANKQKEFDELHQDILKEKNRSKEMFIRHFKNKYKTTDLPIWTVVEIISFGSLSKLFMILQETEQNEVIACMGGINKVVFFKWFKALSSVRNTCAHHSRLWNKTLGVGFEVPRNNEKFENLRSSNNKIFFALSVIEYILTCISEDEIEFKTKIKSLLRKYPQINIGKMGFTENWEDNPIWSDND
ncbi:MAG: Abi family protein [Campylobacterota bacterium]|nr:Abi family protein [Campylobacterota bacterium]